jgi:anti-anti-sigma factor
MVRSEEIESKIVDETAVVYPGEYLNQLKGELIERRCLDLLSQGVRRVVIDFSRTELINSIGISILLGMIDSVKESGGELAVSNLNTTNFELFEVLGLLSHVNVVDSESVEETAQ